MAARRPLRPSTGQTLATGAACLLPEVLRLEPPGARGRAHPSAALPARRRAVPFGPGRHAGGRRTRSRSRPARLCRAAAFRGDRSALQGRSDRVLRRGDRTSLARTARGPDRAAAWSPSGRWMHAPSATSSTSISWPFMDATAMSWPWPRWRSGRFVGRAGWTAPGLPITADLQAVRSGDRGTPRPWRTSPGYCWG